MDICMILHRTRSPQLASQFLLIFAVSYPESPILEMECMRNCPTQLRGSRGQLFLFQSPLWEREL